MTELGRTEGVASRNETVTVSACSVVAVADCRVDWLTC